MCQDEDLRGGRRIVPSHRKDGRVPLPSVSALRPHLRTSPFNMEAHRVKRSNKSFLVPEKLDNKRRFQSALPIAYFHRRKRQPRGITSKTCDYDVFRPYV